MNSLTRIILRILVADGNELLTKEVIFLKALGATMVLVGENTIEILDDDTISLEHKKAMWEQDLGTMNNIWVQCKNEVPSAINTLLNDIMSLRFETLVGIEQ